MKYIVEMQAETMVAMIIEADSEEQAEAEAVALAESGRAGDFLNEYLNPLDFLEIPNVCPTVDDIKDAADMGYSEYRAINI